jgi:hypothetical protein
LRLHGWHDPAILATGVLAAATGFAQFGATSALADVARSFGKPSPTGTSVAAEFGLTLIPLAALPLLGRRLEEPDRFERIRGATARAAPAAAFWAVPRPPCDGGCG